MLDLLNIAAAIVTIVAGVVEVAEVVKKHQRRGNLRRKKKR